MSAEKKWVVKSSDSITGPFEFDQVVEFIFSGEIHLLDEIKGPFERWRPIKDHSLFAAAIEKLKATTYSKRENTITATIDLGTATHEITHSHTGSPADAQTATPVVRGIEQTATPTPVPDYPPMPQVQTPTYQPAPQNRTSSRAFIITFILMVLGGVGYLLYEFQQTKLLEQKISAYDELTDNAIIFLKTGEYQKALKSFNMAYGISPNDPNLIIEMAPLRIQFDGQFNQTQLMIQNLLAVKSQKEYSVKGRNIIGLTFSYKGEHRVAIKEYEAAIALDDRFLAPKINKAFSLIKIGAPEKATDLLVDVVRDYPEEAIAHYLLIRSYIEAGLLSKDKRYFDEALSIANQFPQNFFDFKQEVLFLTALAHMELGVSETELEAHVARFLKVDFAMTNLHVHNTLIDFQSFNWVDYSNHCKRIGSKVSEVYKNLLNGFCLLKVNRTIEAKNIFEALLGDNSTEGILQALYASSLLKLDELSQAKNTLGLLNEISPKQPVVETILRGCLRKDDLSCGSAIFQGQHAKHISLLYSHWGNSAIHLKKDRRRSKTSIQLGLEMSPNFAPLLKLQRQL